MNIGYSSNSIITAIPEKLTCTASIINKISVTDYMHFIKKNTLCQKNIEADNIMKKFLIRMFSFEM